MEGKLASAVFTFTNEAVEHVQRGSMVSPLCSLRESREVSTRMTPEDIVVALACIAVVAIIVALCAMLM